MTLASTSDQHRDTLPHNKCRWQAQARTENVSVGLVNDAVWHWQPEQPGVVSIAKRENTCNFPWPPPAPVRRPSPSPSSIGPCPQHKNTLVLIHIRCHDGRSALNLLFRSISDKLGIILYNIYRISPD